MNRISVKLSEQDLLTLRLVINDFLVSHYPISMNSRLEKKVHRDVLDLREKLRSILNTSRPKDEVKNSPFYYEYELTQQIYNNGNN